MNKLLKWFLSRYCLIIICVSLIMLPYIIPHTCCGEYCIFTPNKFIQGMYLMFILYSIFVMIIGSYCILKPKNTDRRTEKREYDIDEIKSKLKKIEDESEAIYGSLLRLREISKNVNNNEISPSLDKINKIYYNIDLIYDRHAHISNNERTKNNESIISNEEKLEIINSQLDIIKSLFPIKSKEKMF